MRSFEFFFLLRFFLQSLYAIVVSLLAVVVAAAATTTRVCSCTRRIRNDRRCRHRRSHRRCRRCGAANTMAADAAAVDLRRFFSAVFDAKQR